MAGMEVMEFIVTSSPEGMVGNLTDEWNLTTPAPFQNRTPSYINVSSELPIEYAQPMYG